MRAFVVLSIIAVASAGHLGYNYQPGASGHISGSGSGGSRGSGISILSGSGLDSGSGIGIGSGIGGGSIGSSGHGIGSGVGGGSIGLGGGSIGLSGGSIGLGGGSIGLGGGSSGLGGGSIGLGSGSIGLGSGSSGLGGGSIGLGGGSIGLGGGSIGLSGGSIGLGGGSIELGGGSVGLGGGSVGLGGGSIGVGGGSAGLSGGSAGLSGGQVIDGGLSKEYYIYSAPEEEFHDAQGSQRISSSLKRNLRVVFIKAPENNAVNSAALQIAKQATEDKTVIYVLSKQPDVTELANQVQELSESVRHKPEVRFIKYRTQQDAIDAQKSIQQQYDALGGSSHSSNEGTAPVLNYASAAEYHPSADNNVVDLGSSGSATSTIGSIASSGRKEYLPPVVF